MNNILFRFEKMTDASFKVLYTVEMDDLKSFAGVSGSVSMTLELNVFISKDTFNKLGYKAKINTHTTSYIN